MWAQEKFEEAKISWFSLCCVGGARRSVGVNWGAGAVLRLWELGTKSKTTNSSFSVPSCDRTKDLSGGK